jgi:5-hydroxyisourate hydrolase-like protein (transthyretin family)
MHPVSRALVPLLLAACCLSAAQLPIPSPAPAAQRYRISGRVVDAHSGAALSRCALEITEIKRGQETHTTFTDEEGRFSFDGLQVAKYRLTASKLGFLTEAYEQHDNYSTAIAVGPGLVSEDLVFRLTPGAIISGTVTDDAGEPVRGAQIRLFRDQDMDGIRSTQQQGGGITDDRGVYEIDDVRPGAYFLAASARPWYAVQQHTPGSDDNPFDVAYPTTYYPDVTDSDSATPIPIKGGERLQADFVLHAERAMHLHLPISVADMQHGYGISVTHSVFGQPENLQVAGMSSDASGGMEVDGLLPGHYDVTLTVNSGDPASRQTTKHFSAEVTDGSAQVSEAEGETDIAVTGNVVSSEGRLPRNPGLILVTTRRHRGYFARVNDAGEFTVAVPPGSYEVIGQFNRHYLASISATGASLAGRILTVKPGATPHLQISLGNSYGQIDGVVMHEGHPASAAMVLLVPDYPRENRVLFRRDQSDSDGTFTLPGILPGHYRVVAIERGWELEWANPRVLAPFLAKSKPVDVRGNDHMQETIELQSRVELR